LYIVMQHRESDMGTFKHENHSLYDGFQFRIPVRPLVHIHMSAGAIRGTQNLEEVTNAACIVLCKYYIYVVTVHCHAVTSHKTIQCRAFSPQSMHFPIVRCAVYIHFDNQQ
jgi:hypothetical protein